MHGFYGLGLYGLHTYHGVVLSRTHGWWYWHEDRELADDGIWAHFPLVLVWASLLVRGRFWCSILFSARVTSPLLWADRSRLNGRRFSVPPTHFCRRRGRGGRGVGGGGAVCASSALAWKLFFFFLGGGGAVSASGLLWVSLGFAVAVEGFFFFLGGGGGAGAGVCVRRWACFCVCTTIP